MKTLQNITFLICLIFSVLSCEGVAEKIKQSVEPSSETPQENPPPKIIVKKLDYKTTSSKIQQALKETEIEPTPETVSFYTQQNFQPAWEKGKNRSAFLELINKSEEEGLPSATYHKKEIEELITSEETNSETIAQLDLLLTDAFFKYAHDLYFGKIDPATIYDHWGISRKPLDRLALLKSGLENEDLFAIFDKLRPVHPVYSHLKQALKEYHVLKENADTLQKIEKGTLIKPGESDSRMSKIIERLKKLKLVNDSIPSSNLYSERLKESIKTFQKDRGLLVDGIIGDSTIEELNMSPKDRYHQILVNLERWRWYPRDLGEHYILINIPEFRLAVIKDGDTVRTHNVIAGSKARQTPMFTDTLQYVVINPQWHVPPTIKKEDVIPRASKNPSYIASHNMKVTKRDGSVLDPATIDWSSPEVYSYNFVQRAGPSNPLGQIKIIYPNKYLIYLHDTPSRNLFNQNQRAESSGCVRVENAVDLSVYILENQPEWDKEKIRETIASGVTKEVKINRPIQVHHFYWTAWRAGDKTVFTADVYNLDKEIYSLLAD